MINHAIQTSTEQLNDIITENFGLHGNNRITIADLMTGLWLARTVNLNKVANYSSRAGKMNKEDIYRGYQNLIHVFKLTQTQLAIGILKMFGLLVNCRLILSLDRTNWKYGAADINALVLSVVVNGCGVPLFWIELGSAGNSDTAERKKLINMFIDTFDANKISYILGDREFIGEDWFAYLNGHNIRFIMRIKSNMQIDMGSLDWVGCSCANVSNSLFEQNDKLSKEIIYFNNVGDAIKYYSKKEWHIIPIDENSLQFEDRQLHSKLIRQLSKSGKREWLAKYKLPKYLHRFAHMITAGELCGSATQHDMLTFYGKIDDLNLKIQAIRSSENELVIVVSNDLITKRLLDIYKKRWSTKGFNFEDTHFTKKERLDNLTKLLALAFSIALLLGVIHATVIPIKIKTHGRKEHSYFRYGYDLLITLVRNDLHRVVQLIQLCFIEMDWLLRVKTIQKALRGIK